MTTLIDRIGRALRGVADDAWDRGDEVRREVRGRVAPRPSPWRGIAWAVLGGLAGAAIAFLADPDRGRTRRAEAGARAAALARRGTTWATRLGRRAGATAAARVAALRAGGGERDLNDAELAHAVETELFRHDDVPKGAINVNVERGIVVLRGEVPDADARDAIARRAGEVEGAWSVRNLLHLPGEPAPTEELAASR